MSDTDKHLIREAEFNPDVRKYWLLSGVWILLATIAGIPLIIFWWIFGLGVVFDIYITKKVNWSFWKSRKKKNSILIEWLDALIFAVIAVTIINIFLFQN